MKNLNIVCKDFDLTDSIKAYANDKVLFLGKFLNYADDELRFNLRLGKSTNHHQNGTIFSVELSVSAPHQHYESKVEANDIYTALDLLKDEMAENIRSKVDKIRTNSKHEAQKFKEALHNIE